MSRFIDPAITPRSARAAAQWLMRLHDGALSETQRQAWLNWRAADPEHEAAWQRAERVSKTLGMVPPALGMSTLDRPSIRQRRAALKTLCLLIGAGSLGWGAYEATPWREWNAQWRSATGEIRHIELADGSRLALDSASAVDIRFDQELRLVRLWSGAIHIDTAPDPAPQHRPFTVQTAHGRIRALGTRFTVRQDARGAGSRTHVAVMSGAVEIRPVNSEQPVQIINAGWQSSFDEDSCAAASALTLNAEAWVQGLLYADDTPLAEFLAQLARYRRGSLRCDAAVADLRVSGAFRLRDTDAVLHLLQQSLPVRVRYFTRYWASVGAV